mgnify:FL=1
MKQGLLFMLFILGCQSTVPKPKAQLDLAYPKAIYKTYKSPCTYQFKHNDISNPNALSACSTTLEYPLLQAKLYLTYFDLTQASLDTLLLDFDKRLQLFGKTASKIQESAFESKQNSVLGSCVILVGNSPSNLHFFSTDAKNHFLTGSLLFESTPNYDSLAPAIAYIKNDVQQLLESLKWEQEKTISF